MLLAQEVPRHRRRGARLAFPPPHPLVAPHDPRDPRQSPGSRPAATRPPRLPRIQPGPGAATRGDHGRNPSGRRHASSRWFDFLQRMAGSACQPPGNTALAHPTSDASAVTGATALCGTGSASVVEQSMRRYVPQHGQCQCHIHQGNRRAWRTVQRTRLGKFNLACRMRSQYTAKPKCRGKSRPLGKSLRLASRHGIRGGWITASHARLPDLQSQRGAYFLPAGPGVAPAKPPFSYGVPVICIP